MQWQFWVMILIMLIMWLFVMVLIFRDYFVNLIFPGQYSKILFVTKEGDIEEKIMGIKGKSDFEVKSKYYQLLGTRLRKRMYPCYIFSEDDVKPKNEVLLSHPGTAYNDPNFSTKLLSLKIADFFTEPKKEIPGGVLMIGVMIALAILIFLWMKGKGV